MDAKREAKQIRQKNREAAAQAYRNMDAALHDTRDQDGINTVLKFLNEKQRVNGDLSLSQQLRYIEENLQIRTRYAELDPDWYRTAIVPMLVKAEDGHWRVVIPNTDGSCACIENGRRIRVTEGSARQFTNSALCFYKGLGTGRVTRKDLIRFLFRTASTGDKLTVLAVSVCAVLAGMLIPWVNSLIFSHIIPAGDLAGTWAAAALILSSAAAAAILKLLQSLILTNAMLRAAVYLQSGIFARLLSLKPDFFKQVKSGDLSRTVMEFSDISRIVSVRSISACIGMVLSLGYLVQMRQFAPSLFGWVLLVTVLRGVLMGVEGKLNTDWQKGYAASLSGMSGFCYEMFSGIEQIKLNGAEARIMGRWSGYYLDASRREDRPPLLRYSGAVSKLVNLLSTAALFLFGAGLPASSYIAFSAAYGAYTSALEGAGDLIRTASLFRAACGLMEPVLAAECEERSGKKRVESLAGEITVSNLRFRYGKDAPYVIDGLSARIQAGESVGLIGTSGCGKSTFLRLLLGFEQAEEGSIYLDGFDLRELDLKSCRRLIGTVMQNTGLVTGDIYSNITLTKPDASMEEVREAVAMAELEADIAALPMGLHTPVSQENCTLSGGQRQRVLIARALLHRPAILILDEATSALDNVTQARITDTLNKLPCTKIIVAHRLSTIEKCDRILTMGNGSIVEEGSFSELMNRKGVFYQLMQKQTAARQASG